MSGLGRGCGAIPEDEEVGGDEYMDEGELARKKREDAEINRKFAGLDKVLEFMGRSRAPWSSIVLFREMCTSVSSRKRTGITRGRRRGRVFLAISRIFNPASMPLERSGAA